MTDEINPKIRVYKTVFVFFIVLDALLRLLVGALIYSSANFKPEHLIAVIAFMALTYGDDIRRIKRRCASFFGVNGKIETDKDQGGIT